LPAVNRHFGQASQSSGYWMSALLGVLKSQKDMRFGAVAASPRFPDVHFSEDGIEYFVIGQPRGFSYLSYRKRDLRRCDDIINEWRPDLIHIHGTERFYGLLAAEGFLHIPVVISFQGILSEIRKVYFGGLSRLDILRTHSFRQVIRGNGMLQDYLRFCKAAKREEFVIAHTKNFFGRTQWDRAHMLALNPHANYYDIGEVIRPEFSKLSWSIEDIDRYSIVFTNAQNPYKGVAILLDAIRHLRQEFPSIRLRLAGDISPSWGYGRLLRKHIAAMGLDDRVEYLGYLEAEEMAGVLCRSHVYCTTSYMENSPNSVCEAQLVGVPCVASYAGGVPSLIKEGVTGLMFSPGDYAVLADQLREIFKDDGLAMKLSQEARAVALRRHDAQEIVNDCMSAYLDICVKHHSKYNNSVK